MSDEAFSKVVNTHTLFKKVIAPLKRSLGLSFGYMIVFEGGYYYTLIDNLKCLREFTAQVDESCIFCNLNITDYFDGEYSFTLWPQDPTGTAMKIYHKYNICNGVTVSKINNNNTELYWFTKGKGEIEKDWQKFFMRNKRILLEFIHYFDSYKAFLLIPSTSASQSLFTFSKGFETNISKPENIQELYNVKKLANTLHSNSISLKTFKLKTLLSPREVEILSIICRGFPTKTIAQKLDISIKTVNTHIEHIKQKTGLRFKTDLINFYENYFHK